MLNSSQANNAREFIAALHYPAARPAGTSAYAGRLLPHALHFGLTDPDQDQLVRFVHAFTAMVADLPGWRPPEHARPPIALSEDLEKPSIDEQMMDPMVGAGVWLTGW